ncbi:MAG TPA: hypothetical protein VK702_11590 [Candidatus Acidoferrum sp.]|nr:hypothetical protein [Candidatus Acidoferrum sp.]
MKRLCILIAFALASCGGGGSPGTSNVLPTQTVQSKQNASIVIHIPAPAAASAMRPAYVSASTKSIAIAITPNAGCSACSTATTVNQNLTPASTGCVSNSGATTCTIALLLNPGAYTANVTTYDATGETGNVLSSNQSVAMTIALNSANAIPMVLNGIPASATFGLLNSSAVASVMSGSASSSVPAVVYIDAGKTATVYVTPLDADGNAIVGAGAPTMTVANFSGTTYGFSATPSTTADTVAVATPTKAVGYTVYLETQLTGPGCANANPACAAAYFNIVETPIVAVSDTGTTPVEVQFYNTRTKAFTQLPDVLFSNPAGVVFDPSGNLFVADTGNNTVFEFAPPYNNVTAAITNGIIGPGGQNALALDANDDLFVSNYGGSSVTEYKPPYTSLFATFTTGISDPAGVLIDYNGALWVLSSGNNSLLYYPPGFTSATAPTVNALAVPEAIAPSRGNPLNVVSWGTPVVDAIYYPSSGGPAGSTVTLDAGTSYIAAAGGGNFSCSPTVGRCAIIGGLSTTPLNGYTTPRGIAGDANGNLFIADSGKPGLYELAPPYSEAPTLLGGTWGFPTYVAVWPASE